MVSLDIYDCSDFYGNITVNILICNYINKLHNKFNFINLLVV